MNSIKCTTEICEDCNIVGATSDASELDLRKKKVYFA